MLSCILTTERVARGVVTSATHQNFVVLWWVEHAALSRAAVCLLLLCAPFRSPLLSPRSLRYLPYHHQSRQVSYLKQHTGVSQRPCAKIAKIELGASEDWATFRVNFIGTTRKRHPTVFPFKEKTRQYRTTIPCEGGTIYLGLSGEDYTS